MEYLLERKDMKNILKNKIIQDIVDVVVNAALVTGSILWCIKSEMIWFPIIMTTILIFGLILYSIIE